MDVFVEWVKARPDFKQEPKIKRRLVCGWNLIHSQFGTGRGNKLEVLFCSRCGKIMHVSHLVKVSETATNNEITQKFNRYTVNNIGYLHAADIILAIDEIIDQIEKETKATEKRD